MKGIILAGGAGTPLSPLGAAYSVQRPSLPMCPARQARVTSTIIGLAGASTATWQRSSSRAITQG